MISSPGRVKSDIIRRAELQCLCNGPVGRRVRQPNPVIAAGGNPVRARARHRGAPRVTGPARLGSEERSAFLAGRRLPQPDTQAVDERQEPAVTAEGGRKGPPPRPARGRSGHPRAAFVCPTPCDTRRSPRRGERPLPELPPCDPSGSSARARTAHPRRGQSDPSSRRPIVGRPGSRRGRSRSLGG